MLTDAAVVVEGEVSSFSIILVDTASGRRTILYSPNVNAHMCDPVFARDILRRSSWLFLNHLSDVSCVILDDCLDIVAKPGGLKFAWNPGGSQIRAGYAEPLTGKLLKQTDILFLNAEEARTFTKEEAVHDALRICINAGTKIMCITDGANGAFLSDGTSVWRCRHGSPIEVVDTTGAGDAFAVGVTWGVWRGLTLPACLQAGMINAASVIAYVGTQAGLLTETEIRQRLSTADLPVTTSSL